MNDLEELLFFTFELNPKIGEISDNKLTVIESFLDGVNLITLRIAQLEYNKRVKNLEKVWWDDLKVYLGVPTTNTKDTEVLDYTTSVPFGLLFGIFNLSSSNQKLAIKYNWDVSGNDRLFHTNVEEFSTLCLGQEWDILNHDGVFKDFSEVKWNGLKQQLEDQIVQNPHKNIEKKKTLIIAELLNRKLEAQGFESLKILLKIFKSLQDGTLKFDVIENFVAWDREMVSAVGGYINEHKPIDKFDLNDFFEFGAQIIELYVYFEGDFDIFLDYVKTIIIKKDSEEWSEVELAILEKLHNNYLKNIS